MATKPPQLAPVQPVILMNADALAAVWSTHAGAVAEAQNEATLAAPFEKTAAENRTAAQAKRQKADELIAEAAQLEAKANQAVKSARFHQQNEEHHTTVARQIATTVAWLAETNNLTHPAELAQRNELAAAANAAPHSELDMPLDQLVASTTDPSQTAPFAAQLTR